MPCVFPVLTWLSLTLLYCVILKLYFYDCPYPFSFLRHLNTFSSILNLFRVWFFFPGLDLTFCMPADFL